MEPVTKVPTKYDDMPTPTDTTLKESKSLVEQIKKKIASEVKPEKDVLRCSVGE